MGDKGSEDRATPEELPDLAFSVRNMDRSVPPAEDFYRYATGNWLRTHPVPADKSSWGAFGELAERNLALVHQILERAREVSAKSPPGPRRQAGELYASSIDTARRELSGFGPIESERAAIGRIDSVESLFGATARLHAQGISALFEPFSDPDLRESTRYALYLYQGGLSLPTREYYLSADLAHVRAAYRAHVERMFRLWGAAPDVAETDAGIVLELETDLAKASRARAELRDREKNYTRVATAELARRWPHLPLAEYLAIVGAERLPFVVVGQPEFLSAIEERLADRPLASWKVYLSWHLLHANAPYLHDAAESEDFAFFHRTLLGQSVPEPRWKRAARTVDAHLGEALGQLYVEQHFPAAAREKMAEMVRFLSAVFRDRLNHLDWMTETTRREALAKFDRFLPHIGHPQKFRDYSSVPIAPDDLVGNVRRAQQFEFRRQFDRLGGPVDRAEWRMTPPTVNAYFEPTQNEIFFPAGILQPPFFDPTMDDAVNYGGIGAVIGHEITHGYDDQGRKSDASGNLRDWWTDADAKEFADRARQVVELYSAAEPLPGQHINGELTLGENIADFGGVSIAFEALQRHLAEHPERRTTIDGLTPEQRFFVSWAQVWRANYTDAELKRRLLLDPHSPGRYRAVTPLVTFPAFHEAFGTAPAPSGRAATPLLRIW